MAVMTAEHVRCEGCGWVHVICLPEETDTPPLPTSCVKCDGGAFEPVDRRGLPVGYVIAKIRRSPDLSFGDYLPELVVRMADGRARNTPRDRLQAETMRRLGCDEDAVVEAFGYSPEPLS